MIFFFRVYLVRADKWHQIDLLKFHPETSLFPVSFNCSCRGIILEEIRFTEKPMYLAGGPAGPVNASNNMGEMKLRLYL